MREVQQGAGLRRVVRRGEIYTVAIAGVTIVAFFVMAILTDFQGVFAALKKVGGGAVVAVLAAALGNYFFRILRFRFLLARRGFRVPPRYSAQIYVAGFAMTATPGKLGEFIRMWLLKARYKFPYRRTFPIMFTDRADDVIANVILCLCGLRAFSNYTTATVIVGCVFLFGCALLMRPRLLKSVIGYAFKLSGGIKPRLFGLMRQLVSGTSDLFQPYPFVIGAGLGCLGWFLECMALYLCMAIYMPQATIEQAIFIFTFASLVGGLSFLPGGIGGTELTMAGLLSAVGLTIEEATAVTAVIRIGTLWFGISLGYGAMLGLLFRQPKVPQ